MNKRQKKKQVKKAIINILSFQQTYKDRHVINTIGTNKRVQRELNINSFFKELGKLFDTVKHIWVAIREAFSAAVKYVSEIYQEID